MPVEMPTIVRGDLISREVELTYGEGDDHAEGISHYGAPEQGRVLVVFDSPAPIRLTPDGAVIADVIRL